jgi:hypothetical protein
MIALDAASLQVFSIVSAFRIAKKARRSARISSWQGPAVLNQRGIGDTSIGFSIIFLALLELP